MVRPAMDKFTKLEGVAAPLPMINVDTDMIIPKQYLKTIHRTGLGKALFDEMRHNPDGSDNPDFVLNKPVAASFADIFYNNCFKNGILPIKLPQSDVDKLMDDAERGANAVVTVDLEKQEIRGPDGGMVTFEVDPFRKQCLLNGWDDISLTLRAEDKISAYEKDHKAQVPWV